MSNLYPKAHSWVAVDQMTDDISFTSQVHNTETRSLVWEKGKPYVVVTTGGCYWRGIFCKLAALSILWVVSMEMKENNIILFRIHRFFSSQKILLMRISGLILDFGKETHLITFPVVSRVAIGAFSKETSTPPSLQVTTDEEPVPLV